MRIAFEHRGVDYLLIVAIQHQLSPRLVRFHVPQLLFLTRQVDEPIKPGRVVVPLLVGSYLSPQCRQICSESNVAFLDTYGNMELITETLFVSREVEQKPLPEKRKLRSIFSPKGGAILRAMLLEPDRAWKVTDLVDASDSSLGHVSSIRKALIDKEWLEKTDRGVVLRRADLLLRTWRENYRKVPGISLFGYTHFRDRQQEQILLELFDSFTDDEYPPLVYARNSASQYYAPFLRGTSPSFYASTTGVQRLETELEMSYVERGANIAVQVVKDPDILRNSVEVKPGVFCADPITTYLDLWNGNDREREAAEVLAEECFPWLN